MFTGVLNRTVVNSDESCVLKVPKVISLTLKGFSGGNTILDIHVYKPQICPLSLFARVLHLEGDYWEKIRMDRFEQFSKAATGFLLQLTTSDGCDLLLLTTALPEAIEKEVMITEPKINP